MSTEMNAAQPSRDRAQTIIVGAVCFVVGTTLGVWVGASQKQPTPHDYAAPAAVAAPAPTSAAPAREPAPPELSAPPPSVRADLALAQMIEGLTGAARDQALCAIEQRSNREIRYALLERSPARFLGSMYVASGRTIQVQDINGEPGAFVLVSMDSYGSQILAIATYTRPSDDVVADRRVRFYGRVVGTYTYESRGGQTLTVPKVHAVAVIPAGRAPGCGR